MRLMFAGTPDVAVPTLRALHDQHEIALVLTRTDAPVGRKRVLTPSPVASEAEALGLPVLKANTIGQDELTALRAAKAELGVVVAYGALFRAETLEAPARGWINLHFSLLPAWRGAAPLQRSVLAGDAEIGVSVFQLEPGMDTGPLWKRVVLDVDETATASELLADFAERGARVVLETIAAIERGGQPEPQSGEPSLAPKFAASEGELQSTDTSGSNFNRYRAVTREPGAYLELSEGRLKLVRIREALPGETVPDLAAGAFALVGGVLWWGCTDGALALERVQPAGKTEMAANDWWRGRR